MATTHRSKRQPRTPTRAIGRRWSKARWRKAMSTGKPNKAINLGNPSARFAIFLKNEANHTLAFARAGYAYQAESFPTRVRGTAVGFLGAMFAAGILCSGPRCGRCS